MTISFIMKVNNMRFWIHVVFARDKVLDRREMWKCFHAKLAIESATQGVEDLVFLLSTMPDYNNVSMAKQSPEIILLYRSIGACRPQ